MDNMKAIKDATGTTPVGYNAYWMRRSLNTIKILSELGFIYQIDDLSRDEPFKVKVKGKDFVYVPYTVRNNDIVNIFNNSWTPEMFLSQLKMEFDQLYEEGATSRKMMAISAHDRIGGTPAVVKAFDEFITYAKSKPGVAFMRKDEIAKHIMQDKIAVYDQADDLYSK